MKKNFVVFLFLLLFASCAFAGILKLATTTSTDNSGLLKKLLPSFEEKYNVRVDVIAAGTGKAIKLGEVGDVDVILVHSKEAEEKFVADGYGIDRRDVMYNEFVIVGPENDPLRLRTAKSVVEAFQKIPEKSSIFVSRGDNSGTHQKELSIWHQAEIIPGDGWYLETGQGMGSTLFITNGKQGYTLADRGTFSALKDKHDLEIVYQGDKELVNSYGIIAVNPAMHSHVNYKDARLLIEWMISDEAQEIINDFKINGEQLFYTYH